MNFIRFNQAVANVFPNNGNRRFLTFQRKHADFPAEGSQHVLTPESWTDVYCGFSSIDGDGGSTGDFQPRTIEFEEVTYFWVISNDWLRLVFNGSGGSQYPGVDVAGVLIPDFSDEVFQLNWNGSWYQLNIPGLYDWMVSVEGTPVDVTLTDETP